MVASVRARRQPPASARARQTLNELDAWELLALGTAFLLPLVYATQVVGSFWAPKAALSLLLLGPGLVAITVRVVDSRSMREPASWALLVLATAWAATALADRPILSAAGIFNTGTGTVALSVGVAAWGVGRELGPSGRRLLPGVVAAAGLVNATVAITQTIGTIPAPGLDELYDGRPAALMGNPVFLSALLAATIAALVARLPTGRAHMPRLAAIVVAAVALNLAGGRSGLLVGLVLAVGLGLRGGRRRLLEVVGALVIGLLLSLAVPHDVSGTARAADGGASGVAQRLEVWQLGIQAWAERPLLGWGPGRFEAATAHRTSLRFARAEGPGRYFGDAHNLPVELLTTTGALGVVAMGGFVALSIMRRRRPTEVACLAGATAIAGCLLLEPQAPSLVPALFLLFGAAVDRPSAPIPRAAAATATAGAVGGLALAVSLLVGTATLARGQARISPSEVRSSARWLPPWPQIPMARFDTLQVAYRATGDRSLIPAIRAAGRAARDADPAYPGGNEDHAQSLALTGQHRAAVAAYQQTLRVAPYDVSALAGLLLSARETGQDDVARQATRQLCALSTEFCALTR